MYATVQVRLATRVRLSAFKENLHETYDGLLNALMDLVPSKDEEGEYCRSFKRRSRGT